MLQQKIEKLLTDRVERLLGIVERQNFKIAKIADVLQHVSKSDKNLTLKNSDPPPAS